MNELSDSEMSRQGHEAFQTFAQQFGAPDIYLQALLDVIFGEVYGEVIPLPGETGQEDDQNVERQ